LLERSLTDATSSLGYRAHLANGERATILLIEDDGSSREALCEILAHAGYSVVSAENGRHALDSVQATGTKPELILLDLAMPVMDGVAFLANMPRYAQLVDVPVIIMSADSSAARVPAELPKKVLEVLPKPINVRRMMELVRKHTSPPAAHPS